MILQTLRAALLGASALLPLVAHASEAWPIRLGTQSAAIGFANASTFLDPAHPASPALSLAFPTRPDHAIAFTMDTGSVGIVATPDHFRPAAGAVPVIADGLVTYSSSGRQMHGSWYMSEVDIRGRLADGSEGTVAVARVPVLQVTRVTCLATARECQATDTPTGVAMMGVGFGRAADQQAQATPDKNPLLNITQIREGGALRPVGGGFSAGYVVTSAGVTLGLTAASTAGATLAKLLPSASMAGDWQQAPALVTVTPPGGQASGGLGASLMDTGVNRMFLGGTNLPVGEAVPPGTRVEVVLGAGGHAGYAFTVGRDSALAPAEVIIPRDPSVFVNTGRNLLNGFDVIFDSANGYVGYRLAQGAGADGYARAGVSLQGSVALPSTFVASAPVTLLGDTMLATSGTAALSGGIAGQGHALGLSGGGTFNLAGPGSYTGGTTVSGGATLALNDGREIGGGALTLDAGALSAGASYTLRNAVRLGAGGGTLAPAGRTIELAGTISGSGGLTVSGPGAVLLAGSNSYSGGTLVRNGSILAVGSDAALGAPSGGVTLSGATLRAMQSFATGRAIAITPSGATIVADPGVTLRLDGPVTHGGPVRYEGGGQVVHAGALVSTQRIAAGPGLLTVGGSLVAPALEVLAGGVLSGGGTISAPTSVSGTLAPGQSPGVMTFAAPVAMLPGSTLAVEIDGPGTGAGAGNTDLVRVVGAGNGFAAAGTIAPVLRGISGAATNGFVPTLGQSFAVVQAESGVTGGFAAIAQPAAGLPPGTRFDALYGANEVRLVVTPSSYAAFARTPNQAAAGAALDALRPAAGPRPADATAQGFSLLYQVPSERLGAALDALSGTPWGDALGARLEGARGFGDALTDQLAAARGGPPGGAVAAQGGNTAWLRATGQPMLRQGSAGAPGYTASAGGVAAGLERQVAPGLRIGAALGYASTVASPRLGGRAESESLLLGVYGGWTGAGGLFVDADVFGGPARDRVRRSLAPVAGGARGAADGSALSAGLRGGIGYRAGAWAVEPSLGFRYLRADRGAAAEQGAGGFGLVVSGAQLDSARVTAGVALRRDVSVAGMALTPSLRAAYARELGDARAVTSAGLQGLPGVALQAGSAAPGRDAALLGAGLAARVAPGVALSLDYAAELRANFSSQSVSGALRWSF